MTINDATRDSCAGKCDLCGGESTAFWDGAISRIEVCAGCATTKLIQLIVDSYPRLDMATADSAIERIKTGFYRGVAARWAREGKQAEVENAA